MASNIPQWLLFVLIAVMFVPVVAGETLWLVRKGWCAARRALAFSLASNGIGMAISSVILFAAASVMFMLVMGPSGEGSSVSGGVYAFILAGALTVALFVLIAIKLFFFRMLGIRSVRGAFLFSAISSVALMLAVVLVPSAAIYFLG